MVAGSAPALTAGEQRVLAGAPSGRPIDLSNLPEAGRVVSGELLRRLCVGSEAKDVDPGGLRVKGAIVRGSLGLAFCAVPHLLHFEESTFAEVPDFYRARLPGLSFVRCQLPGLHAFGARLEVLSLLGSEVRGEVNLLGARIDGTLECGGATLASEGGPALSLDGAEIRVAAFLRGGFSATGEVRLLGAKIGGQLDCSGARLTGTRLAGGDAMAFSADRAEIGGDVFLGDGFEATGTVRLDGAKIGGRLECIGTRVTNPDGLALYLDGAEIAGNVFFVGLSASGEVRLVAAKIGGGLECRSATLENRGNVALRLDGAQIGGPLALHQELHAIGEVRLHSAKVAGQLRCTATTLNNEGGDALTADRLQVDGDVFLRMPFSARGTVRLPGAVIGGVLDCSGASLDGRGGDALVLDGARVGGSLLLRSGFSATGEVRLNGATIGDQLELVRATLRNEDGLALSARDAEVGHLLMFRNLEVTGGVDLFRANATTLDDDLGERDDGLGSWNGVHPLDLEGFTYARFSEAAESSSKLRRRWLRRTSGFQLGAWQQLVSVYRAEGRDDEVTSAAVAMQNDRLARAGLPWYRRAGRWIFRLTLGHGYRPWLAGVWALAIIAAFATFVALSSDSFAPEKQEATGSPQPLVYAADTFLPIIDFGEAARWMPTDWTRWVEWVVILLGWALSTIFVAGFTRIVRS